MVVSILVVDDEADVAELFRQRFRREVRQGTYAMHFAHSGAEALGKLDDGIEPELIVIMSDINMPEMDGLTLLGETSWYIPKWLEWRPKVNVEGHEPTREPAVLVPELDATGASGNGHVDVVQAGEER